MDFNSEKEETFARALKPNSIKTETKNWNTLEGYVYVISKRMPVADGDPPLNCVKIGMSNITTRDRFKKGFQRLSHSGHLLSHSKFIVSTCLRSPISMKANKRRLD